MPFHSLYSSSSLKSKKQRSNFYGLSITQTYHKKAPDKRQAIIDMLNIQDAKKFVLDSGYFDDLPQA